ncbi:MAG: DUF1080 domain-containing protein [Bryobacterales bacterium]|nr:DUF1080 domain-containing protein [Bryobacterales bacterium]
MLRKHWIAMMSAAVLQALLFWQCAPSAQKATVNKAEAGAPYNGRWLMEFDPADRGRVGWLELEGVGTPDAKGLIVGAPGGGMYPVPGIDVAEDGSLRLEYPGKWGANIPEVAAKEREAAMAARAALKEGEKMPERASVTAVYTAKLEGDKLVGKLEWPDEPARFQAVTFTAKRAPVIDERDDGTWVAGETVELVPGKASANENFTVDLPSKEIGWMVRGGNIVNDPPAGNLTSKEKFWNFDLHAEYKLSEHSNSGIGLRGRYEVQIMEDYGKEPYKQGHGAIYYRHVPTSNPSKKPGEWQTMDIRLIGREVSVTLNGVKIQDKKIIDGLTAMATDANEAEPGPITLQGDHEKVEFRKLTVTKLEKKGA